jgi:quercetin dioxygenase-like cupin family protein
MVHEFITNDELRWQQVEEGIQRAVIAYDAHLMLVKVRFKAGWIGAVHSHVQSQITYVESGVFEVEVGARKQVLRQGDSYYVSPDALHGARCLEDGILLDTFSPIREDFIPSNQAS